MPPMYRKKSRPMQLWRIQLLVSSICLAKLPSLSWPSRVIGSGQHHGIMRLSGESPHSHIVSMNILKICDGRDPSVPNYETVYRRRPSAMVRSTRARDVHSPQSTQSSTIGKPYFPSVPAGAIVVLVALSVILLP
jgi:hypothetical protein